MLYSFRMELQQVLPWIEIVLAVLLIGLILLQRSGAEVGGALGGGGDGSQISYTRRGAEKVLFYLTIAIGVIFIALNLGILLLSQS